MGYVETLFGHQAPALALDALRGETAVSAGGRDKSVRFWKIPEETQLVFRGGGGSKWMDDLDGIEEDGEEDEAGQTKRRKGKGKESGQKFVEGSIECVAMIDESTFVSGGDSGYAVLFPFLLVGAHSTQINRALDDTKEETCIYAGARARARRVACRHGRHAHHPQTTLGHRHRRITVLGPLRLRYAPRSAVYIFTHADTRAGSWDGTIRLWKLDAKLKSFALVGTVPVAGVVNSLHFCMPSSEVLESAAWARQPDAGASGKTQTKTVLLVAGVGHETRLGRWVQRKGEGVLNGALVVALHPRT